MRSRRTAFVGVGVMLLAWWLITHGHEAFAEVVMLIGFAIALVYLALGLRPDAPNSKTVTVIYGVTVGCMAVGVASLMWGRYMGRQDWVVPVFQIGISTFVIGVVLLQLLTFFKERSQK